MAPSPGVPSARQTWIALSVMFGAWLSSQFAVGIALMAYLLTTGKPLTQVAQVAMAPPVLAIGMVITVLALLTPAIVLAQHWKLPLRFVFRLWPVPLLIYPCAALGMIAVGLLSSSLLTWLKPFVPSLLDPKLMGELGKSLQADTPAQLGFFFVLVALVPATYEELVFRGFLQRGFESGYRPAAAIALSSAFFGLIHGDPFQGLGAMMLGGFLGFLAWRTGSLFPCMVAHAVQNGLFVLVNQLPETHLARDFDAQAPLWAVVTSAVVLAASVAAIWRLMPSPAEPVIAPAIVEAPPLVLEL